MSEGETSSEGVELFQSIIMLATAARKVVDSATVQGEQAAVPTPAMAVLEATLTDLEKKIGVWPQHEDG